MLRKILLFVVLVIAVAQAPAFAGNPMVGSWRASSGFIVEIPDRPADFELIFIEFGTHRRIAHPARWIKVGQQFAWTDKQNASHTATLDPKNPNRIQDVNSAWPGSPAYWYRVTGGK